MNSILYNDVFIIIISLLFIILVVLIGLSILNRRYYNTDYELYNKRKKINNTESYVSMTTIPDRLKTNWFYKNLKDILKYPGKFKLVLNIPQYSLKNVKYEIPDDIKNLENNNSNFIINRVDKDEGPITKLLPSLRNPNISDDSTIIVIDDDVFYKKYIFNILSKAVNKYNDSVCIMCDGHILIEGFKGFAFKKKLLKPLLDFNIPESCKKIDDDVITIFVHHNNIPIKSIAYNNEIWSICSKNIIKHIQDDDEDSNNWGKLASESRGKIRDKCYADLKKNGVKFSDYFLDNIKIAIDN